MMRTLGFILILLLSITVVSADNPGWTLFDNVQISGTLLLPTGARLYVAERGGHSIGTNANPDSSLTLGGERTIQADHDGYGLLVAYGIAGAPNQNVFAQRTTFGVTTADWGIHPVVASLEVEGPGIGAGLAPVRNMVSLYVATAPVGGIENYSFLVAEGVSRFNGGLNVNGNPGLTQTITVRNAAGTGTCTLVFKDGLKTGGTC